jgi:hypothetical protein
MSAQAQAMPQAKMNRYQYCSVVIGISEFHVQPLQPSKLMLRMPPEKRSQQLHLKPKSNNLLTYKFSISDGVAYPVDFMHD